MFQSENGSLLWIGEKTNLASSAQITAVGCYIKWKMSILLQLEYLTLYMLIIKQYTKKYHEIPGSVKNMSCC